MSALANDMARLLWWYMLWLMRRPWMKALQRRWLTWVRESRRENAKRAVKRQNAWARKWGLPLLRGAMTVLLISVLITITYLIATNLYESGAFQVPQREK